MRRLCAVAVLILAPALLVAADADQGAQDARAAFDAGRFKEAAAKYLEAAATDGLAADRVADLDLQAAWASYIGGDTDAARDALKKAYTARPQLEVMPAFYSQDFADLAATVKAQTVQVPPANLDELKRTSKEKLAAGMASDVVYDLKKFQSSTDPEVHELLAQAYDKLGQAAQAEVERQRASQLAGPAVTSTPIGALAPPPPAPPAPARGSGANVDISFLVEAAQNALAKKDYKTSSEIARQAEQANPNSAIAHRLAADAALGQNELVEAEREYIAAVTLDPNDPETQLGLARIADRQDQPNTAAAHYRRALELDPRSLEAALGLGKALAALGDSSGARLALGRATEIDPSSPDARARFGAFLSAQGDFRAAIDQEVEAVRLAPEIASYHARLGGDYRAAKMYREAGRELAEAVRLDPGDLDSWKMLGSIQMKLGAPDAAADAYARALELSPVDEIAVTGRAAALAARQRWEQVRVLLSSARARLPGSAAVANDLGVAQYSLGMLDEAVASLQAAHELARQDESISARLERARAARDLGKGALEPVRAATR
jgi:tetratricopeptide (TPR) repeat protein